MADDKSYPTSLAGSYFISFSSLSLKPICLIDTKPSDHQLKQIRCEAAGLAFAEFDNGIAFPIYITFDKRSSTYFFHYGNQKATEANPFNHSFQILANLSARVNDRAEITSWVDLGQLAEEEVIEDL